MTLPVFVPVIVYVTTVPAAGSTAPESADFVILSVAVRASSITRGVEFDGVVPFVAVALTETVSVIEPVLSAV